MATTHPSSASSTPPTLPKRRVRSSSRSTSAISVSTKASPVLTTSHRANLSQSSTDSLTDSLIKSSLLSTSPIVKTSKKAFRIPPDTNMGVFGTSRERASSAATTESRHIPLFTDGTFTSFHPLASAKLDPPPQWESTFSSLKVKAQRSIPMLRSISSPIPTTVNQDSVAFPRSSTSSEETATDATADNESFRGSFRKRAKAWGRPSIGHGQSPLKLKHQPLHEDEDESTTDVEWALSDVHTESSDDEGSAAYYQPPKSWVAPREFTLQDPVTRYSSRCAPQEAYEVPYTVCYDKVLMEADDHTHDLIKALIPNRTGLSFHEFSKNPASVLDLGCGEGRWVIEAAQKWKNSRFVGLDLMDIQPDISPKYFDDIRDRVQWVHSNFLHFRLPFEDGQFDYVRMSHISLAVPDYKWKRLISEIRRILKSDTGVLEWIDEDSTRAQISKSDLTNDPACLFDLEHDFRHLLRQRAINSRRSLFRSVPSLLKGRAMFKSCEQTARFDLALSPCSAPLSTIKGSTVPHTQGAKLRKRSSSITLRKSSGHNRNGSQESTIIETIEISDKPLPPTPHTAKPSLSYPRGMIILNENKLLPLCPNDLEAVATRNFQVLLGSKEALWRSRFAGDVNASRQQFEQQIWDYECNQYSRLNLPTQPPKMWDDSDDESANPTHSFVTPTLSAHNNRRRGPITLEEIPSGAYNANPIVVRSIRVFIASGDGK